MNENFITKVKIENFKCFKSLEIDEFKRVNLIVGKNNVGKTALMEACWIYAQNKNSGNVLKAFANMVNTLTLLEEFRNLSNDDHHDLNTTLSLLQKFDRLSIEGDKSVKLNIAFKDLDVTIKINDDMELGSSLTKISLFEGILSDQKSLSKTKNFIPSCKIDNELMIILYDRIKEYRRKDKLKQYIHEFDQDISEFEVIKNLPKVFLESQQQFADINELGHGLKRYITIISAMLIGQDNCLFMDEIENGLHYTHLDKLWEIILKLSKELNCQVFATTHSKECIESFYKVSKKLDDEGICLIELGKVDNEIKTLVLDKEMFFFEFEQNHEVRGW